MALWSTKAVISLKRVKIEEKDSRDCPFFPVPPIISGTGKAKDFKFGQYIQGVHPNKSPLKFLEKRERGCIQGGGAENAGPENAGLENDGLKSRTGKCRTGICQTKEQGWKMQD